MGYQEAGADSDALDGGMMKVKLIPEQARPIQLSLPTKAGIGSI